MGRVDEQIGEKDQARSHQSAGVTPVSDLCEGSKVYLDKQGTACVLYLNHRWNTALPRASEMKYSAEPRFSARGEATAAAGLENSKSGFEAKLNK